MTAPFEMRARTDQRFPDALSGPDGTSDPSVLMPVLQVYPDALSAPMPDAMVPVPPVGLAAALAAAGKPMPPQPAPRRAQPVPPGPMAQPARYGRPAATARPAERSARPAPSARGSIEPRGAMAPHLQAPRRAGTHQLPMPTPAPSAGWAGRTRSPGEVADFLRNTFSGMTHGGGVNTPAHYQPPAHAPTPSMPRNPTRRNRGASVWAVFVFLVVIVFASGLGQQIINAISELFNR